MDENYISLLWPQNKNLFESKTTKLAEATVSNLDIAGLCSNLSKDIDESSYILEVITNMCWDEEVITYRQEIFQDIISSKELGTFLFGLLLELGDFKFFSKEDSSLLDLDLWKIISRLNELKTYIKCIRVIKKGLELLKLNSKALIKLREIVLRLSKKEEFEALERDIEELYIKVSSIKSIKLGMNLDSSYRPTDVVLLRVNNIKFKDTFFLKNVLANSMINDHSVLTKIKTSSKAPRHHIMNFIKKDLESSLRPIVSDLKVTLNKYRNINGRFMLELIPELMFYMRFVEFINNIRDNNLPVCRPVVTAVDKRESVIKDIYNINLATHMLLQGKNPEKEIILNDVNFDEQGRILILTGPNMGGKTVFTVAIGLSQVLFQAGIYVPGTKAHMSPVDGIYTHFSVDENQSVDLGRLGEECKRLSEIFKYATRYSLILLNESLASTSFLEGKYIAQEVVRALRFLGIRALFNTHIHELASYTDIINKEIIGDSLTISLVTGIVEGERSYRIYPAPPLGKSYARDIAMKHGVSFEQLSDSLNKRKISQE